MEPDKTSTEIFFKDASLYLFIEEIGGYDYKGINEIKLILNSEEKSENNLGVFTRINVSREDCPINLFLKKFFAQFVYPFLEENFGNSVPEPKKVSIKTDLSKLTFDEYCQKKKINWLSVKEAFWFYDTHALGLEKAFYPFITCGLPDGASLKFRGNVLSLCTKNNTIDSILPKEKEDSNFIENKQFKSAASCGLKLFDQFFLKQFPKEDQERVVSEINDFENVSNHTSSIFLTFLEKLKGEKFNTFPEKIVETIHKEFEKKNEVTKTTRKMKM